MDLKVRASKPSRGVIFRAVQRGTLDHSASCVVITGIFPGIKRMERDADTYLLLVPSCEYIEIVTPSLF
jgi:hypothetical protein